MEAVVAFITMVIEEVTPLIPTITADAGLVVSLVSGAREALTDIGQAVPTAVTTPEFQQLDASVTTLEGTWAAELAAAKAAQGG